jgi:L-amino acid N-acyltransferase YncA
MASGRSARHTREHAMKIRTLAKKLKTTDHGGRVAVLQEEHEGVRQVRAVVSLEDTFGFPEVLCHLKLSPAEARTLGEALLKAVQVLEAPWFPGSKPAP